MLRIVRKYGFCLLAFGFLLIAFTSCNTTKFVPQDQCLLNKARIKCADNRDISGLSLRNYLRQKQNTEIFGFWKLQLHIYNTAPADTVGSKSKKRLAENAFKMGEAPIIYDEDLTRVSMQQLKQRMNNMGYFQAEVDTQKVVKNRKVDITYLVTANEPYKLRRYNVDIPMQEVRKVATNSRSKIEEGDLFSTDALDEERERIASSMRNKGYFNFEKSVLEFTADSALKSNEVDVTIHMAEYVNHLDSAAYQKLFTRYYIRNVVFVQDSIKISKHKKKPFLRNRVLQRACLIKTGDKYSDRLVERTYSRMNALPPVKYVDISFAPVGDSLDCFITVSRGKLNSISAEVEGTYSAGDWGIAAEVNYSNKNIFRGAEALSLGARASYEWRANGGRAIEAKAEAGLLFPTNVKVNVAYNFQRRPDEYTRTIANAGLSYTIPRQKNSHWTHQFNLVDINYVYLPWMSQKFIDQFFSKSSVLRASYEDHFIVDWSYSGTYSTYSRYRPNKSYIQLALRAETAGNALYGLSKLANFSKNDLGEYVLWNIPFAQYAKGDFNFTYHGIINPEHHIVTHIGLGVAVPYLNASSVPFTKRYFAGGANGIRGWQAHTLGPGTFRGDGSKLVYDLQVGDIKLDLNLEYRYKVLSFLELAAFLDAGNIWTIDNYSDQPGGVFLWDEFYKQIAWSYGVGVRFDLSLFIFRVDFGVKLHDPSRIAEGKQWRTATNGLCWRDDMTFHFAIGYPF